MTVSETAIWNRAQNDASSGNPQANDAAYERLTRARAALLASERPNASPHQVTTPSQQQRVAPVVTMQGNNSGPSPIEYSIQQVQPVSQPVAAQMMERSVRKQHVEDEGLTVEQKDQEFLTAEKSRGSGLRSILVCYGVFLALLFVVLTVPWAGAYLALAGILSVLTLPTLMRSRRIGPWLSGRWAGYAQRRPQRAETLRRWADAGAMLWDRLLDYLPAFLADRLSMPDFSQPIETA